MRRVELQYLIVAATLSVGCRPAHLPPPVASTSGAGVPLAQPNDNRVPAGTVRGGVLTLELDAVLAGWRPDLLVDTAVTVQAFAERGRAPQIPGPLIRVPAGTEVRVIVRNLIPDSALLFHGPTAVMDVGDTVRVPPGATRELRFIAALPGTYRYRGRTDLAPPIPGFSGRDSQLTGAIVVDPSGSTIDPRERIFVLTLIDIWSDSATTGSEEIWEAAINGRSWPHTERLRYDVGGTVRWRWVNATDRIHPMHLHGFHFRVLAKGNGRVDTSYAPDRTRLAVTETMLPGTTFRMEWNPTRAGNWLMHCHMIGHITPFPERPESTRAHDVHEPAQHGEQSMAGLVLGITTVGEWPDDPALARGGSHYRLFVQESRGGANGVRKGYVLQRGSEPAPDSVEIPGSTLLATRGRTTTVTVINRLSQPTSVHWHGMELESVFDGVPGFSGVGSRRAPLIAPGDSFTVAFTPPRTGTYMYHTHMDEEDQLAAGLYAPLIVLEPGSTRDPARDLTLVIGHMLRSDGERAFTVNGRAEPAAIPVRAGVAHRIRLINLLYASPVRVTLVSRGSPVSWRWVAKDGADVAPALTSPRAARLGSVGVGEAYDLEWTPAANEQPVMVIERFEAGGVVAETLRQQFRVEP